MNGAVAGLCWALGFIVLESVQFVFFGHIFQQMSSVLFGVLVFGISSVAFIAVSAWKRPTELATALRNVRLLLIINVVATLSWLGFLMAVQLIEPAIAYTIGSGAMPLTAYLAYRFGLPEGENMRNWAEGAGTLIILLSLVFLGVVTVLGYSGFVRGGFGVAVVGVLLAFFEGIMFTLLLIYCQRLDRKGVGAGTVFGLRFVLYMVVAGALTSVGFDHKEAMPAVQIVVIVLIGLLLIIPPLYALQRAVSLVSTLTISALTALGPFLIFLMQIAEGRVEYAPATLVGLALYFIGAIFAALGAVRATVSNKPADPAG